MPSSWGVSGVTAISAASHLADMEPAVLFRCVAGLLAAAGVFAGFTSYSVGAVRDPMNLALFVIPNCVLSAAFIVRCVHAPRAVYRRVLWLASVIVHGIWLAFWCSLAIALPFALEGAGEVRFLGVCWLAWLVIAVCLSLTGLRTDDG
jgi:hypothetical protein